MANLRYLKKEIDYCLEEVVFDCDMAICFQPSKETEIFEVMQEAVAIRNDLFTKANSTMLRCVPRWSVSSKNSSRSSARSTRRKSKACSFRIRAVLHGGTAFFAFIRHWKFSRQLSRLFSPGQSSRHSFPPVFLPISLAVA